MLKKTKNKTLLSIILLIVALLNIAHLRLNHAWAEEQEVHYWGLIVQGYASTEYVYEGDSQYMYHLMSKHYMFDEICYLAYNTNLTGVTNETTKENADWAITEWLNQTSGPNDIVFIFLQPMELVTGMVMITILLSLRPRQSLMMMVTKAMKRVKARLDSMLPETMIPTIGSVLMKCFFFPRKTLGLLLSRRIILMMSLQSPLVVSIVAS